MSLKKKLRGTFKNKHGVVTEELEVEYQESAEQAYKEILSFFNNTLNPGESEREFVSAEWVADDSGIVYCDFVKTNSGTLKDSKGYYDRVVCTRCGRVRRRRRIDSSDIKNIKCKIQKGDV